MPLGFLKTCSKGVTQYARPTLPLQHCLFTHALAFNHITKPTNRPAETNQPTVQDVPGKVLFNVVISGTRGDARCRLDGAYLILFGVSLDVCFDRLLSARAPLKAEKMCKPTARSLVRAHSDHTNTPAE